MATLTRLIQDEEGNFFLLNGIKIPKGAIRPVGKMRLYSSSLIKYRSDDESISNMHKALNELAKTSSDYNPKSANSYVISDRLLCGTSNEVYAVQFYVYSNFMT